MRPRRRGGVPKGPTYIKVRLAVFARAHGICELNHRYDCIRTAVAFKGKTTNDHGYLHYIQGYKFGGKTDNENCRWACWRCELLEPCKEAPRVALQTAPQKIHWSDDYYDNC